MRHLQNEELVGLVFDELPGEDVDACREHIQACASCGAAFAGLSRAVVLLEKEPTEPPPPFAWSRLKARVEQSRPSYEWHEPAWGPLILGNAGGIILVLIFIFLIGGWLENAPAWQSIRTWPLAARFGPQGLIALGFFSMGALVTLALTPIFWWESRRPCRAIVK
jgi:hypothetical protein